MSVKGNLVEDIAHKKRDKLIRVVLERWAVRRSELELLAEQSLVRADDPDWPWSGFILSFATMGGSDNWINRIEPRKSDYSWQRVCQMSASERAQAAHELANPRRRHIVIPAFEACFQKFQFSGGPSGVRSEYLTYSTARERIAFLRSFQGIGDKYSRNIPMDIYDPLVRNHFAIDHRIKKIFEIINGHVPRYRFAEEWLNQLARDVGINAWYFDRLLYNDYDAILHALEHER